MKLPIAVKFASQRPVKWRRRTTPRALPEIGGERSRPSITRHRSDVTVLLALGIHDEFHDEFTPLKCQSCPNIVLGGGFCRVCKTDGTCTCEFCQQPIGKKRAEGLGEDARTKRGARCGKCRIVVYCGRACQRADWKQHKKQCAEATQVCHSTT